MPDKFELDLPFPKKAKIALALSGGRDSVALAHAFSEEGVDFFAVHVEHGIRGENSLRDRRFVEEFCKDRAIRLEVFSVDALSYADETGLTVEQAARELRYSVFGKLIAERRCDYVALAHHADDQTETVLMRIFRGTGIRGLKGMSPISGSYVRPLLRYSRADIDEYVAAHGLPYVEDETNADTAYTRNFLRAEIVRIKERYPSLNDAVARLAHHADETEKFIAEFLPPLRSDGREARVAFAVFERPAVGKRAVYAACESLGVRQDIEERHFALIEGLSACENGKRIELPHGITVHKEGGDAVFSAKQEEEPQAETPLFLPDGSLASPQGAKLEAVSPADIDFSDGALYADVDKIPSDAVLRRRREGDRIRKFGGGSKSFGDFLTDKKVPLRKRDGIVVCATGGYILFAAGICVSEDVRIDASTKRAVKISV